MDCKWNPNPLRFPAPLAVKKYRGYGFETSKVL
jgi:hypothetical protein